jgi:hypothetical protein
MICSGSNDIKDLDITKETNYSLFNFIFKNEVSNDVIFTAPARLSAADLESDLVTLRRIWYDIALSKTFSKQLQGDKDEFLVNVRKLARAG